MCACVHVCVCVITCVCMRACTCVYEMVHAFTKCMCVNVCVRACVCVCVCVCVQRDGIAVLETSLEEIIDTCEEQRKGKERVFNVALCDPGKQGANIKRR